MTLNDFPRHPLLFGPSPVHRLDRLTAAGWTVLHVTLDDLRRPESLVARVRALRARRLAQANTR